MSIKKLFLITLTLLFALCLAIIPMPVWAVWLRPGWVALVLIYWTMALPGQVSVGIAWFVGLILDALNGTLLGEHALALVIVVYVASRLYRQIRVFPVWQQSLWVGFFILLYQLTLFLIQGITGNVINHWQFWLMPLSSIIYWPFLYVVLQGYRRHYKLR